MRAIKETPLRFIENPLSVRRTLFPSLGLVEEIMKEREETLIPVARCLDAPRKIKSSYIWSNKFRIFLDTTLPSILEKIRCLELLKKIRRIEELEASLLKQLEKIHAKSPQQPAADDDDEEEEDEEDVYVQLVDTYQVKILEIQALKEEVEAKVRQMRKAEAMARRQKH